MTKIIYFSPIAFIHLLLHPGFQSSTSKCHFEPTGREIPEPWLFEYRYQGSLVAKNAARDDKDYLFFSNCFYSSTVTPRFSIIHPQADVISSPPGEKSPNRGFLNTGIRDLSSQRTLLEMTKIIYFSPIAFTHLLLHPGFQSSIHKQMSFRARRARNP